MRAIVVFLLIGALSLPVWAQNFELSAELRPRFEFRHGYGTLAVDTLDAVTFISQRTRLNFNYESERLNVYLSLQNVRVWGDVSTLSAKDVNGIAVHEAWAEAPLTSHLSMKIGRQEIVYDDQRLFGNVGWAQTARSHDALIATFKPNDSNRLDFGLALNEASETLFETSYNVNNYKAFQYVWYHANFKDVSLSLLALNTGFAYDDDGKQNVVYNQTLGTHVVYGKNKLKAEATIYVQTGKLADVDLSAYNFALNINHGFATHFNVGFGAEYLSGTDMNSSENKLKSFTPWFGTNHKFNGWMDYFYVGNHSNSVGLIDLNATLAFQKDKFSAKLMPHVFSAAATVVDKTSQEMNRGLGTELDLVLGYNWTKETNVQVGYSQLFATETMEVLKGGNRHATHNWAWVMFTFKPKLFSYKQP
ncbi:alginate export family protein [Flavobacteriaceae bacterium LMO-SS05]